MPVLEEKITQRLEAIKGCRFPTLGDKVISTERLSENCILDVRRSAEPNTHNLEVWFSISSQDTMDKADLGTLMDYVPNVKKCILGLEHMMMSNITI